MSSDWSTMGHACESGKSAPPLLHEQVKSVMTAQFRTLLPFNCAVEISHLGYLAPRMSFSPYFIQLFPSSGGPSRLGPEETRTCSDHFGCIFLQYKHVFIRIMWESMNLKKGVHVLHSNGTSSWSHLCIQDPGRPDWSSRCAGFRLQSEENRSQKQGLWAGALPRNHSIWAWRELCWRKIRSFVSAIHQEKMGWDGFWAVLSARELALARSWPTFSPNLRRSPSSSRFERMYMGRDRGCNSFTENGTRVRTDVKEMRMTPLTVDHSKELEKKNERVGNFNGFFFFFIWQPGRAGEAVKLIRIQTHESKQYRRWFLCSNAGKLTKSISMPTWKTSISCKNSRISGPKQLQLGTMDVGFYGLIKKS